MATKCHVRSVSLPTRSHPSNVRLEEELNKLKRMEISSTSTSGSICIGLSGLESLYDSLEDVINLASTRGETIKCLNEAMDGSDKVLDICSILVDSMLLFKEHVVGIQSALRRRKDVSSVEASVKSFTCFRKQLRKTSKKLVAELKQKENKDQDQLQPEVVRVLHEVDLVARCIFRTLLAYLSVPFPKVKNSRWSSAWKVLHKGSVICEETRENLNEIALVDASLTELGIENVQVAQERLEKLEIAIEGLEKSLESLFRRLMKTRASLLNMMSQ